MDVRPGDTLQMKKPHPCGSRDFLVLRSGMDFKIRCVGWKLWSRALSVRKTSKRSSVREKKHSVSRFRPYRTKGNEEDV